MSHWRLRTPFRGRQKPRGRVTVGSGVWEQMPLLLLCFHAEGKARFDFFFSTHNCRLTAAQTVKLYDNIIGCWRADCCGICVSKDTETHQEKVNITNQFDMRIKIFPQACFLSSAHDCVDDSCSLYSVCFRYICSSVGPTVQNFIVNTRMV